jgi:hypothetical protein
MQANFPDTGRKRWQQQFLLSAVARRVRGNGRRRASPGISCCWVTFVGVDLILPPDTAPERLTHRIAYALKAGSVLAPMYDNLKVDAPHVTIARQTHMALKPPVKGDGWLVSSGCCKPNLHRDLRVAIDGLRIETPEAFAVD